MRDNITKIIALGLILVLGFISYRVFIVPKTTGIKTLRGTLKRIELQLSALFGEEVTLRGGAVQQEELLRQLEKLKTQIPSEKDLPRVMDDIITKASEGLKIDYRLIEPQEIQVEGRYKKLPLKIKFVGNYYDFSSYLAQLLRLPTIITIDNLKLQRLIEEPEKLETEILMSAFVMGSEPGEPAGAAREKTPSSFLINPFGEGGEEIKVAEKVKKKTAGPSLKLQGIWKGKETRAFINGKIVRAGDLVDGYKVVQIKDKAAVLTKEGKRYTLTLK